jgi:hypothetical protein
MSSEKYINSTYSLSESILRLNFINSYTYVMLLYQKFKKFENLGFSPNN